MNADERADLAYREQRTVDVGLGARARVVPQPERLIGAVSRCTQASTQNDTRFF